VCGPAHVTRLPGSASGPWFVPVHPIIPSLDCRAWKGRSNPLLLSALRFAPESRPAFVIRSDGVRRLSRETARTMVAWVPTLEAHDPDGRSRRKAPVADRGLGRLNWAESAPTRVGREGPECVP